MSGGSGAGPSGGRPSALDDLIAALQALREADDVERVRVIPSLIEASKSALSAERAAAADRVAGRNGRMSIIALAGLLGVHRSKIDDLIAAHRKRVQD